MDLQEITPQIVDVLQCEDVLRINTQLVEELEAEGNSLIATLSRKEINTTISITYAAIENLQKALEKRKAELSYLQRENTAKMSQAEKTNSN